MFLLIPTLQRLPCPYTILQIVSYAYFKLLSFYKSEITLNCVLICFYFPRHYAWDYLILLLLFA